MVLIVRSYAEVLIVKSSALKSCFMMTHGRVCNLSVLYFCTTQIPAVPAGSCGHRHGKVSSHA